MRLINYGVGEIIDRLTILSLKILYGRKRGTAIDHFETERNALLVQLRGKTLNGAWFEQVLTLGAINSALWRAEDDLRGLRFPIQHDVAQAGELAFDIQSLNDLRAAAVEQINKLTGDHLGQEKI